MPAGPTTRQAKRLSPSKRKHGEEEGAAQAQEDAQGRPRRQAQRRLTDMGGARVTKAGGAGLGGKGLQQQKPTTVPKEVARLGSGLGGGTPTLSHARHTRAAVAAATPMRTRSAVAAAAPKPAAAAVPAKPPAKPAAAKGKAGRQAATAASKAAGTSGKAAASGRRAHLHEAAVDGETFRVGDSVYLVLDLDAMQGLSEAEEKEVCPCIVCGGTDTQALVMLECDRCLAGCHLGCCTPPLAEVPEGEWVCPECAAGRAPAVRRGTSARERFLQRQGLGLARIEAMWREPNGEVMCTYRWYCVPEETHTGRQAHHLAREVFLTQQRDADSVDAILRKAAVLPPAQFTSGAGAAGEDVFVCEYQYDSAWQRFRRQTEFDSDSEDEGEDWAPAEDSSDSEDDEDGTPFKAAHEMWAARGVLPKGGVRRKGSAANGGSDGGAGLNRRGKKAGEQFLERFGALAVPEHARQRRRERQAGAGGTLSQARSMLTLAAVPRTLPCRDSERAHIAEFVEEMLSEDGGKCLYVSGIPGTGKTATVLEVMRTLKRKSEAGSLPKFQFVEINGLRLPSPQHAYSALYEALTGDRVGPQAAAQRLEEMFSGSGGAARRPTIVLVDEMDLLVNKTQTVLYNLFDWPGRKGSRLSIIGIANTMDLPERLHARISSRLSGRRLVFQPYTKDQLTAIIMSRLEGVPAFQSNAVELVSRKVANCSGDVRRCLELCRRAAEIAEERMLQQQRQQQEGGSSTQAGSSKSPQQATEKGIVEMRHVGAAIAEMFDTGHVKLLTEACRLERLLLAAVYMETSSRGRAECLLVDAWERLRVLCSQNCEAQPYDFSSVVESAVELGAKRLIICDPGARRVRVKVALNVAANDLLMVLGRDPDLPWLEQAVSRAAVAAPQVPAV